MRNQEEKVEELEIECPHCKEKFSIYVKAKAESEISTELQIEQN